MTDFFDVLARVAQVTIESDYYDNAKPEESHPLKLKKAIIKCNSVPVISEIKVASPSAGVIRKRCGCKRRLQRQCRREEP